MGEGMEYWGDTSDVKSHSSGGAAHARENLLLGPPLASTLESRATLLHRVCLIPEL